MLALLLAVFIVFLVGGLSLLAHWARKNRSAEITLVVTVLFASLSVILLAGVAALSGLAGANLQEGLPPELFLYSAAVVGLAGLMGLALCVLPLLKITGRGRASGGEAAGREAFAGSEDGSLRYADPSGRRDRGITFSDPPTFFALWVYVVVVAYSVVNLLFFVLAPEVTDSGLSSGGRVSVSAVLATEVPFAIVAFLGVGLGVRRSFGECVTRLGYERISPGQVGIVVLFVVGALVLQVVSNNLFAYLQPELFERVNSISTGLFDPKGLDPIAVIFFALLVGVGAGVGEETLYRGALQPALGIPLVSVLFAILHVQYGPSLLLVFIFVLSAGLGLLRKYINTTASFLAHAGYNASGVLLAYFLGV